MKIKFIVFLILTALFVVIDAASTARGQRPKPPKPPPVSVVVSDNTPDVGQTITLTVGNTSDPNPKWVLGKKQFRYGRSITLSWPSAGQYTITVIAKDLRGKSRRSSILVTVTAQPPIIDVVSVPTQSLSLDPVVFNAQATDPGGQPVSYFWDLGDGQISTEQNPTHSYSRPGSYTVKLTVTDQTGTSVSQESPITILNRVPIALFNTSTPGWWVQTTITFDGRASHDLDGRIVNCRWDMGDGSVFQGPYSDWAMITYQYRRQASYIVTLTVTDDLDGQASRSETIVIGNRNPIAKITVSTTTIVAGKTITFDGTASTDPDNDNLTYAWNFGDNTSGTGVVVEHLYATAGTYTPALTVTDDWSATATASITITVTPPPPPPRWPPTDGGATDFPYLGNSKPPTHVGRFKVGDPIEGIKLFSKKLPNGTEEWFIWALTLRDRELYSVPQGVKLLSGLGFTSRSLAVDKDGGLWSIGYSSDEDGNPILSESWLDHHTFDGRKSRYFKYPQQILGLDKEGFLYIGAGVRTGPEVEPAVVVFDTISKELVRDANGNLLYWLLPRYYNNRPTFPFSAVISGGVNLWMIHRVPSLTNPNNSVDNLVTHFNRLTGQVVRQHRLANSDWRNIAVGPKNELVLAVGGAKDFLGGDKIIAIRPDTGELIWSVVTHTLRGGGIYSITLQDGIMALCVTEKGTGEVYIELWHF